MTRPDASCSFCREHFRDVGPLVEGPGEVYICAECVELCQSIIIQEKRRRQGLQNLPLSLPPLELFQTKLHSFILSPATDLKAFAAAVHSHYHNRHDTQRTKEEPSFLLLVGASRTTAMLLARVSAHILEVPFASGSAENIAPLAKSSESILLKLLNAGDFDGEAAQRGIVLVDGIDSRDAQAMLVNVLAETGEKAFPDAPYFDGASILFVCLGSFVGLDEQMARQGRHPEQPIRSEDLLAFGVLPEFVRSVRAVVRVAPLDEETVTRLAVSADLNCFAKAIAIG